MTDLGAHLAAPPAAAADGRRRSIVEAAAQLFDQHGYLGTSMAEIAEAAGLRKSTLYHYFKSKTDILFAIHDGLIEHLLENQRQRERQAGLTPTQELLEVMGDLMTLVQRRPGHFRVFFENTRQLPPDQGRIVAEKRNDYRSRVQGILERAIESGEFREVDVHLATLGILGMCNWAYQWLREDGPLDGRQVALAYWNMLVDGMKPAAAPDR
jgi:TetR/AcrR family transcriptional regulator, cholesterol catabolism regulator